MWVSRPPAKVHLVERFCRKCMFSTFVWQQPKRFAGRYGLVHCAIPITWHIGHWHLAKCLNLNWHYWFDTAHQFVEWYGNHCTCHTVCRACVIQCYKEPLLGMLRFVVFHFCVFECLIMFSATHYNCFELANDMKLGIMFFSMRLLSFKIMLQAV